MYHSIHLAMQISTKPRYSIGVLTNLSAPSMHTYFALLNGFALSITSLITTPVNNAVDTPAGPHEKPFDLRTTFCSFLLLPAHTSVMG